MSMSLRCMPEAAGGYLTPSRPAAASCPGRSTAARSIPHAAPKQRMQQPVRHDIPRCTAHGSVGAAYTVTALPQSSATASDAGAVSSAAVANATHSQGDNGNVVQPSGEAALVEGDEIRSSSSSSSSSSIHSSNGSATGPARPAVPPLPAKALLQAVTYTNTQTLPPQPHWQAAAATLAAGLTQTASNLAGNFPAATTSGVLRFEVALPRTSNLAGLGAAGFTALQWLQGQEGLRTTLHQVYFSGRHSTAPDTADTAAAEAAAGGWEAIGGLGAAWIWQGPAQQGFDSGVMSGVQRFLSEGQPRLRILGGSRFNQSQSPAPEWAAFGSYLFLLPQIEVLELGGTLIMAINCAWDTRLQQQQSVNAAAAGAGPASLAAAVDQALNMLQMLQPPARASSPSLAPATGPASQTPDYPGWQSLMTNTIGVLRNAAAAAGSAAAAVDTDLARQEFISRGQQGLDELLTALRQGDPDPAPMATLQEEAEDDHAAAAAASSSSSSAGGAVSIRYPADSNGTSSSSGGRDAEQQQQQQTATHNGHTQQQQQRLVKVVLARRTAIPWQSPMLDSHATSTAGGSSSSSSRRPGWQRSSGTVLLQSLQERDPRAYQLYLSIPPGAAFLACTPERLYVRSGRHVASEAVAGTRPRGPPGDLEADFYQGLDLLQSPKDHAEFTVVRDWIKQQLTPLCVQLRTEVQKSVLKQSSVQHLYGRLAGVLKRGVGDAAVLAALHPTPAVCGRPREQAFRYLEDNEPFDRGFYAGPFGWVSGQGAEFVVAIRSAMIPAAEELSAAAAESAAVDTTPAVQGMSTKGQLLAYAGVGVVPGSEASAEWQELCLKVRQFEGLLSPLLSTPLQGLPNHVMAWATLLVEELCRLGVSAFAVAPGSRSSPLALAAASHPRSQLTVAIDERSLGYWALGFSRGNPSGMPAAVICSSGTAVANLLPAVVEASQSNVPLLLLTADRPYELRDTGANQTIDQVKIFGGYTRWSSDVTPPSDLVPGRVIVSTADTAVRYCVSAPRLGPVHLNFQFREPLAPKTSDWNPDRFLRGLEHWMQSAEPYTSAVIGQGVNIDYITPQQQQQQVFNIVQQQQQHVHSQIPDCSGNGTSLSQQQQQQQYAARMQPPAAASPELGHFLQLLQPAKRGLIVVGEQSHSGAAAAAVQLAAALDFPVAADVLSGLRVGSSSSSRVVCHLDQILLSDDNDSWWMKLQPDVIVQVGPRMTSKRINQFVEWSAMRGTPWCFVHPGPERHDANHLVNCHLSMPPQQLLHTIVSSGSSSCCWQQPSSSSSRGYADLLSQLDQVADLQIDASLAMMSQLSEMAVARKLSDLIPPGSGLFLGNSMPIRDMDMYAGSWRLRNNLAPADVSVTTIVPDTAAAAAAAAASPSSSNGDQRVSGTAAAAGSSEAAYGGDETDDIIGLLPPGSLLSSSSCLGPSSSSSSSKPVGPRSEVQASRSLPETLVGIPVAANRGASGIDGVLSTATGFACGLKRPVTLVIGDLSFLHDVNGLALLRTGEMSPPLTVVLINNRGGGIFSFLPVAGSVGREAFERLWGTPQNVDLEGLCRAHGIPHQRVTSSNDLSTALNVAWGINRHSVVEVITDRSHNLTLHKQLQAGVQSAVHQAYDLVTRSSDRDLDRQQQQQGRGSPLLLPVLLPPVLRVTEVQVLSYSLPLAKPLTSVDRQPEGSADLTRRGLFLTVTLAAGHSGSSSSNGSSNGSSSSRVYQGIGEAAPLPGLHTETLDQVLCQLQLLRELLQNVTVPYTLPLLSSRGFSHWLTHTVGLNPDVLYPSVRFALETALLQALAAANGCEIKDLLLPAGSSTAAAAAAAAGSGTAAGSSVCVNGLLPGTGSSEVLLSAAQQLVQQGFRSIKIKVGRRQNPEDDASVITLLHQHLNPLGVTLVADANRAWDLDQALRFGRALAAAAASSSSSSSVLAYIEEPTSDPADMLIFYAETGIPVAVDESLDQGIIGPTLNPNTTSLDLNPTNGLAAVILKPSVVGGFEAAWGLVQWAQKQGLRVVISSSFESSVGIAALAQLAAAVDASSSSGDGQQQQQQLERGSNATLANGLWSGLGGAVLPMSNGSTAAADVAAAAAASASGQQQQQQWHGLGTLSWFTEDVVPSSSGFAHHCAELPTAATWSLLQDAAAAAAGGVVASSSDSSNGKHSPASASAAAAAAELSAQQVEIQMDQVHYEVHTPSGVKMTVTGILAHAIPSSSSSRTLPIVLLHGFMGSAEDWRPLMSALAAAGRTCLAINLPGHGGTKPSSSSNGSGGDLSEADLADCYSIPATAAVVETAAAAAFGAGTQCLLVGYSMGARVAFQIGLQPQQQQQQQHSVQNLGRSADPRSLDPRSLQVTGESKVSWVGAVVISGTPGMPDPDLRCARILKDAELANMLTQLGSERFLAWWYDQPLWRSLRSYPGFSRLLHKRGLEQTGNEQSLAMALKHCSTGKMKPLWGQLKSCQLPMLLIAGELDTKFAGIKRRIAARLRQAPAAAAAAGGGNGSSSSSVEGMSAADLGAQLQQQQQQVAAHQWAEVPGVGHAVHVEAPVQLLKLIQGFIDTLEQ